VTFQWQNDDWFGALKTGLVHHNEAEVDRLENEALARGWKEKDWQGPLQTPDDPESELWAESLRKRLTSPFQQLERALGSRPSGDTVAQALTGFWRQLRAEEQLEKWTAETGNPVHATFWQQMQSWAKAIALAFSDECLLARLDVDHRRRLGWPDRE
jgi:ATP-dependent helicase/DNAse subunit B